MAVRSTTAVIEYETDFHAHFVSMFVQTAPKLETGISAWKAGGETEVDAKSGIAAFLLGVGPNEGIIITADGNDGEQAVERPVELVRNNFGPDM